MPRPIQARIDLDALASNLRVARAASSARIMAVVKANGYGHGLPGVVEALQDADGFALLDIADGVRLREAGVTQPILLLEGFFGRDDLPVCADYRLSCVIHSAWQLAMLNNYPQRGGLDVWLKINTGMNRLGFIAADVPRVMETLRRHPAIGEITLMSHCAHADEARGVKVEQAILKDVADFCRVPHSLANSAALLRYPKTHGDWVRPGIMLYGASPFVDVSARHLGLRPVMTLSSRIIATHRITAGDEVGYGALYRADKAMRVGIVACGYADGYPRHALTGTPVLVDGELTRTLGRVSMDMLCVDLSALPRADYNSEVVLWGEGLPVEHVAHAAGTISYELLCALTARVPRRL
ncbi:MAG: alanine racemase [Pseudomonadota bacterium]